MALKRQLTEFNGGDEDSQLPIKRQHIISTIFNDVNDLCKYMEPLLQKLVQEEVQNKFDKFQRSYLHQIECSGSRTLHLQFWGNLHNTLFTGSRIMSEDNSPVKIILYDSTTKEIVASGPHSSIKVNVLVLDGDFGPADLEDWSEKEFASKIVQNREGKRPLVTGELTVHLQNGIGFIGQVSFTDNSSWIRSGRFRLGAKAHPSAVNIREAMSNPFKVKDHRGESHQKHYPPSLNDYVWRLDKIAKDGSSHKRLTQYGISSVQDFLWFYETNQPFLRSVLSVSNKIWETITNHAKTCNPDGKRYLYRTELGTGLLFNSLFKVVEVTLDGHNYHSMDNLNMHQMGMVEDLKQCAYQNRKDWVFVGDQAFVGFPTHLSSLADKFSHPSMCLQGADFHVQHGQLELQMNNPHSAISSPYDFEVEQENSSFEIGESSQTQEFNLPCRNSFQMSDSSGISYGHTWIPGANFMELQLSNEDLPADYNFQE